MVLFIGNSRLASPLGVREIRKSARRSCGFAILITPIGCAAKREQLTRETQTAD